MRYSGFTLATYLSVFVCLADQLSKRWVISTLLPLPQHALYVIPYLNLILLTNKGITFGLLNSVNHQYATYALISVAVIVVLFLGRWLWYTSSRTVALALGVIIGGAVGNVIDRLRFGAVVDFLDFHFENHHWYAFNLADAAIVTGVSLLLLDSVVRRR